MTKVYINNSNNRRHQIKSIGMQEKCKQIQSFTFYEGKHQIKNGKYDLKSK
jgi:hypothetical protein